MTSQTGTRDADPVFVDHTGRRRRLVAAAATAGALILTLAVLALLAGFTGVGPGPVPGWPAAGTGHDKPTRATPDRTDGTPSATPRPGAAAADATSRPPAVRPTGATSVTSAPTTSPTSNIHRRVPTHTPTAHPSKKP